MSSDSENDYVQDEYINDENDPFKVEKITQDDFTLIPNDEKIDFDETFDSIKLKIINLTNYDHMQNERVLDALRKGKFRKHD